MFWLEKDISKVENTLLQWILQNILENQTFQKIAKFIIASFYEMDFMKDTWNLLATVYWSRDTRDKMEMDDRSCFAGDTPIHFLCPSFNKGQT